MPTADDDYTIPVGRAVCLDVAEAAIRRLTVQGTLRKQPGMSVHLTHYGNFVVDGGTLDIEARDGTVWRSTFIITNEAQFVGGGNAPVDSDIGSWFINAIVNLQGAPKTAWTRLTSGVPSGISVVTVYDATGWRVGDEIAISPTESSSVPSHYDHFDVRVITAITGTSVTLDRPLSFAHPSVSIAGRFYTAEVLNLSRNIVFEGRPGLRTHFFVRNTQALAAPPVVRYALLRYMGPQSYGSNGNLDGVLGRWALHFHRCADFCDGALIEGAVVRDFGNHAFVTHDTNGVTYRNTVAFDGANDAYWWDADSTDFGSDRILYDRAVAARLFFLVNGTEQRGFRLTGFFMGQGPNVGRDTRECRDCVAVGIRGSTDAAGFVWPELGPTPHPLNGQAVWRFNSPIQTDSVIGLTGNLGHNNRAHGLFTWQNNNREHIIRNYTAYHNGGSGVAHGAYGNCYLYENTWLYRNSAPDLLVHALTANCAPRPGLTFRNLWIDAGGKDFAIQTARHNAPGSPWTIEGGSLIQNYARAGVRFNADGRAEMLDIAATVQFTGNRYWLESFIDPGSQLRDFGLRLTLYRLDQRPCAGSLRPEFNAYACPN